METKQILREIEEKRKTSKIDMVICYRHRYFGINFSERSVKEMTFEEAYGLDFFDWDSNICIASEENKQRYDKMRGKDGLGFGKVCKLVYTDMEKEFNKERGEQ